MEKNNLGGSRVTGCVVVSDGTGYLYRFPSMTEAVDVLALLEREGFQATILPGNFPRHYLNMIDVQDVRRKTINDIIEQQENKIEV